MSCRRLFGSLGRPRGRDFHRQNKRNPFRCQRMKVSGLTTRSAGRQAKSLPRAAITNRIESVARRGFALRSSNRASCLRRNRFSAAKAPRDRKHRASKRPRSNSTARPVAVACERAVISSLCVAKTPFGLDERVKRRRTALLMFAVRVADQAKPPQISEKTGGKNRLWRPERHRPRLSYGWRAPVERRRPHSGGRPQRAQQGQQTQVSVTQRRASYIDDEGHRAGHWRSPSQTEKACFRLAADAVCPYRGNREFGRRDSS